MVSIATAPYLATHVCGTHSGHFSMGRDVMFVPRGIWRCAMESNLSKALRSWGVWLIGF